MMPASVMPDHATPLPARLKTPATEKVSEAVTAGLFVLPGFVLLAILFLLPVIAIFVIAATDWQFGATHLAFVGFKNFREVFADPAFRISLLNTFVYVLIVVPGTIGSGLLIALLIEARPALRGFYRAIHFLPFMATLAATAVAWEMLLHPTIGLVNQVFAALGLPTASWLRNESTVLPVLALIGIWQNLGFAMVLFLAGLKAIPNDLYQAAEIDGADGWFDRLRTVTLPMLGPVAMFAVIVVAIRAFEAFDTVAILTQGGPGHASELILYTLYREGFEYLRTGYGAAVTVVFLGIIVTLTLVQIAVMEKRVHYS
jgi:multiple sugar transport system permease protein